MPPAAYSQSSGWAPMIRRRSGSDFMGYRSGGFQPPPGDEYAAAGSRRYVALLFLLVLVRRRGLFLGRFTQEQLAVKSHLVLIEHLQHGRGLLGLDLGDLVFQRGELGLERALDLVDLLDLVGGEHQALPARRQHALGLL